MKGPGFGGALDENDDDSSMLKDETDTSEIMNDEVQEVMKDNLDLMLEVVMKIREDEEFARDIYANCPRLQHLLDEHPDLKPVFEDPKLVRLNFEQVYRDNGGVLPEDKPKKKSCLSKVVNHPLFKVLRFFLLIKKLVNCVMGGGFSMLKGCFAGLCFEEAAEALTDGDGGGDAEGGDGDKNGEHQSSPENQANKEKLNAAADHMEDPEVQERMNEILENNPDDLAEAIENDPELKALRDSNPLCAELMAEPDTMRILVDPDNLRALGECPDLIEQDFSNPDWAAPDDIEFAADGVDVDPNADVDADADAEDGEEGEEEEELYDEEAAEEGEMEEEENMMEDFEMEEQDRGSSGNAANKKSQQKKNKNKNQNNSGGAGGFFASVGAGVTEMIAAEVVGFGMGDLTGGGDDLGGLDEDVPVDDLADAGDAAEAAASAADHAEAVAAASELVLNDDVAGGLEDGMDEMVETHDESATDKGDDNRNAQRAKAGAIGAAGGLAVHSIPGGGGKSRSAPAEGEEGEENKEGKTLDEDDTVAEGEDGEEAEGDEKKKKKKKSRFGVVGSAFGTLATAAKEHVASALLGDDFGEMLVEKIEDDKDEDDEEKNSQDGKEDGKEDGKDDDDKDGKKTEEKKGRRRFRRNKK